MPHIHLKQPGQPVADFSVSGAIVTVAGVAIDCAARQLDTLVTVEIRDNDTGPAEGGDGAYLAQIAIPARHYRDVPSPDNDKKLSREPLPLDSNAIAVTLWPIV